MADKAGDSLPVQDPTDAELRLWSAFSRGEMVDLGAGDADAGHPREADRGEAARRVRGEVVAGLMLGAVAPAIARVPRLRVTGARVEGTVDVRGGKVTAAVEMRDCSFTGNVLFANAQIRTIDLSGSVLDELNGSAAEVSGSLILQGCRIKKVGLTRAHISGWLNLNSAKLANPGENALYADGMRVDGGMFCGDGFQAQGQIRLVGARIGGALVLSSANLANPGGAALTADRMSVDGSMFCTDGFQAQGEIGLRGAHIIGQLGFRGASLANAPALALAGQDLQANSLLLDDTTVAGTVDLTSARVQELYDDPGRWPPRMGIDEFTYQSLQPYTGARGASGRLAWLARTEPGYRAQPYEQLAAYYRRLGHDEEARRVLLAKQRRRRDTLGPAGKTAGYLLDGVVGYGYRPGRAFAWLVALLVAGSVYFTYHRPAPLDPAQHPHYQPVLYTAEQLIPLVNLSQANVWAPAGASQWVSAALVVLGWVLATAIVAGVTRVLARV